LTSRIDKIAKLKMDDTPPPYSDTEFDNKLSLVLEASLSLSSDSSQRLHVEEEWEIWDESKFQLAALARERDEMDSHAQVAGTSHQIVSGMTLDQRYGGDRGIPGISKDGGIPGTTKDGRIPGTIKVTQVPPRLKAATGTAQSPVNGSDICSEPPPVPNPLSLQEEFGVSCIDDESAPPPFSLYDTSLDGPPFEEVVSEGLVPSYPHDGSTSSTSTATTLEPLLVSMADQVDQRASGRPLYPATDPQMTSSERSSANSTRPIIPLTVQPSPRFNQRSTSGINRMPAPRLDFNASMAYHDLSSSSYPYPTAAIDASAFYK
jgi:hypothetical protein